MTKFWIMMTRLLTAGFSVAVMLTVHGGCDQASVLGTASRPSVVSKVSISVAAASDLKYVLEEVIREFQELHPHIVVKATFGSSGNFYTQISNGAPFDIFLSADTSYPQKLIEQGVAIPESLFVYAIGRIVLWVRQDSALNVEREGIASLRNPNIKKLAIANPVDAPYGRAAEAALHHFDVYEDLKDRLVLGENVTQAAQFVETEAADVGIIAVSLAIAVPLRDKGRQWPFPTDSYPTLEQGGVILSATQERSACDLFCAYMRSERGREVFKRYAFALPGESKLRP